MTRRTPVLEQVLVTAQRREQAQQEVPISIQVVGTDLLDDVAADDLGDLSVFVPGLEVSSDSPTQPRYSIRGIRHERFRHWHRSVGRRLRGRRLHGAVGRVVARVQRHRAHRGAEGTAGHLVRPQQRRRRDLDRDAPAVRRLRRTAAPARRRVRPAAHRGHDQRSARARTSHCASTVSTTRATAGCRMRRRGATCGRRKAGRFVPRCAGTSRDQTAATLTWDRDEIDQLARPAFGVVPAGPRRCRGAVPARSGDVPRSAQGTGLQRRDRQRGIARARRADARHRARARLGRVALHDRLAPVRHVESRGRGRHESHRDLLRHARTSRTTRAGTRNSSSPERRAASTGSRASATTRRTRGRRATRSRSPTASTP